MPINWGLTATPSTVPATGGTVQLQVTYTLTGGKSARHLVQQVIDEAGTVVASSAVDVPAVPGETAPIIVGLTGASALPPAGQYGVRSSDGQPVTGSGTTFSVVVPAS